jgi:hypothetical protein
MKSLDKVDGKLSAVEVDGNIDESDFIREAITSDDGKTFLYLLHG